MSGVLTNDLEVALATLMKLFAEDGDATAVSILALGSASIEQTDMH